MKHRLFILVSVLCLVLSIAISLVHPQKAFADEQSDIQAGITSLAFADSDNIVGTFGSLGQIDFLDTNTSSGDTTYNYTPTSGNFKDPGTVAGKNGVSGGIRFGIDFSGKPNFSASTVSGVIKLGYVQGTSTTPVLSKVQVANPDITGTSSPAATAKFSWDSSNITSPSGASTTVTFTPASDTSAPLYIEANPIVASGLEGGCPATAAILLDTADGNTGTLYTFGAPSVGSVGLSKLPTDIQTDFDASKCTVTGVQTATISGTQGSALVAPGSGSDPNVADNQPANSTEASCDAGSSFSLNWIFCGVFDGLSDATGWVQNNLVIPQLKSQPICVDASGTSCDEATYGKQPDLTYKVWSNFRVYGDVALVVFLLVAVFGEAIGGGVIEAYTVRRVLPRLLAAAILINLSIYIVALLVDLTNIIGGGIGQLLTDPLSGSQAFVIHPSGILSGASVATGVGISALILGASHISALFSTEGISLILVVIIIPALLAMIAVFVTIAIRKAIILALIFVSPVAFALYCLPNTEKYFRKWWDLLSEMLMVYPIVVVFFAIGDIMSVTTQDAAGGSAVTGILSLMFLVIPLLLIPFAFRLAGQSIGRIHDAVTGARQQVNSMTQSHRDRARQHYGWRVADRRSKMWNSGLIGGTRDENGDYVRRGLRGRVEGSTLGRRSGLSYALGRRMENVDQQIRRQQAEMSKDPGIIAVQHDDDALRAKTYSNYGAAVDGMTTFIEQRDGVSADVARTRAQRAARAAQVSGGFGAAQASWALESMGQTGTAIRSLEDQSQLIDRVSGGNASTRASLSGNLNAVAKQVGRHELAPGFGTVLRLATQEGTAARGLGPGPSQADYGAAAEEAWASGSLYQHANDRQENIDSAITRFTQQLGTTDVHGNFVPNPDRAAAERAAVFFHELRTMAPNATGVVKGRIDTALADHGVQVEAVISALDDTPNSGGTSVVDPTAAPTLNPATGRFERPRASRVTAETARERIDRLSRSYERPDPNHLT